MELYVPVPVVVVVPDLDVEEIVSCLGANLPILFPIYISSDTEISFPNSTLFLNEECASEIHIEGELVSSETVKKDLLFKDKIVAAVASVDPTVIPLSFNVTKFDPAIIAPFVPTEHCSTGVTVVTFPDADGVSVM